MPMSLSNIPSILLILLIAPLTFVGTMLPAKHDIDNKKRPSNEEHGQRSKRLKEIQHELESILNAGQLKDAESPTTQHGHQPHPKSEPDLPESSSHLAASSRGIDGSRHIHPNPNPLIRPRPNQLETRNVHQITGQMHQMHIVKHEEISEQEKQWHANERAKKIIADLGEEKMQKIRQRFSGYLSRQKAKTESQPKLPQSSSSRGVGGSGSDRQHNLLAARDIHQITGQMRQMQIVKHEDPQTISEEEKQWLANERAKKIIADLGEEEMQKIRQRFSGYLTGQKAKTENQLAWARPHQPSFIQHDEEVLKGNQMQIDSDEDKEFL